MLYSVSDLYSGLIVFTLSVGQLHGVRPINETSCTTLVRAAELNKGRGAGRGFVNVSPFKKMSGIE